MLRISTRFIGNAIRNHKINHTSNNSQIITQFSRNYGDGNYLHAHFSKEVRIYEKQFFYVFLERKTKFAISDEAIDGRPLYLDAQATTPLVRLSIIL